MRVVETRCERRVWVDASRVKMTRVSNVLNSERKDYDLGLVVGVPFDSNAGAEELKITSRCCGEIYVQKKVDDAGN